MPEINKKRLRMDKKLFFFLILLKTAETKYYNQLLGARSAQKLVEIHNRRTFRL